MIFSKEFGSDFEPKDSKQKVIKTERLGTDRFWESQKFREGYFKVKSEKGIAEASRWYLDFKDKKPFNEAVSPEEAAALYSSVILDIVKELKSDKNKIEYVIDCRRHGEKGAGEKEGKRPGLTEKGELQGKGITTFKPPYYTGDVYISEIPRTGQFADAMRETEWQEGKRISQTSSVSPKTIVSHDLMMEPFLYYVIGEEIEHDQSLKGGNFTGKIGGPLEEAQGFTIKLKKKNDNITANLMFRNKEYDLDISKIKDLVKKYKDSWG